MTVAARVSRTERCRGFGSLRGLAAWAVLGLMPLSGPAAAEGPVTPAIHTAVETRLVLSTVSTVTGEPIRYPTGGAAKITAVEITLQPGQETGWHVHPVPLFGYVLEGELTVNYGAKGERTYRAGEGLAEAMNQAHNGRNTGQVPMKILAVFAGVEGLPGSTVVPPPVSQSAVP